MTDDQRVSMTPRVAQPDEFFPLASEEMIRRGAIADAVEHCRRGLIFYPDNISGYAVLANAYLLLEEPDRAANVLRDGHRRTGAERLAELADLIEGEKEAVAESEVAAVDRLDGTDSVVSIDETHADVDIEEPLIPASVEAPLSPVETLSHTDAEEQGVEDRETEEGEREGLSFITDDPSGPHYVTDPAAEAEELYPYGSDEREDEDYDHDLTDRMIARSDESLFGNEVRPTDRDLFTGEPLPNDAVRFDDSEGTGDESDRMREGDEDAFEDDDREVDLIPPVEDIIVPAPRGEFSIGAPESVDQLIPMPRTQVPQPEPEHGETGDVDAGADADMEVGAEDGSTVEEWEEDAGRGVIRPEDPTAGMAAAEGRADAGDLADLIDEDSDRMIDEGGSGGTSGLSLHSGTQISDLRSRNLRLIPGLEYAPLRRDEGSLKIAPLVDERKKGRGSEMPPLGGTPRAPFTTESSEGSGDTDQHERGEREGMTPLEELARRLETARIPAVEEEHEEEESLPFEPSLVSDTFASILVSQGAYAEAIKAYQMLARLKPERRDDYEKKIAEVRWQMGRVEN